MSQQPLSRNGSAIADKLMEFARTDGVLAIRGLQAVLIDAAIQLDNNALAARSETGTPIWRPIATAPMDGTEILLTRWTQENGYGHIDIGAWEFIEVSDADGQRIYDWKSNWGYIEEPTHWMPKPEEPK